MLIYFLVLIGLSVAQQELCYKGPGDVYTGFINVTTKGDSCESWSQQSVIALEKELNHNYCRVLNNMTNTPYCIYNGQKQSCDVPICDESTLRFEGSFILFFRNATQYPNYPIVAQQINFYFKVSETHDQFEQKEKEKTRPLPVLVQVKSSNGSSRQHISVILQNGFLKLVISLDSYNSETFVFGGPVSYGDVHYVSVNRSRSLVFVQLNDTTSNFTLTSQDTEFLVSPYQVLIGDNYYGCMTGLSIGTWVQIGKSVKLLIDRPFPLYDGSEIKEFTIRNAATGSAPQRDLCMFAPTTFVRNSYTQPTSPDAVTETSSEAAVEVVPKRGSLDQRSIIIISVALGVIFTLTLVTLICVKRNQHFTPQGYNLEVM